MKKQLLFILFTFCAISLGYSQADCPNALTLTPGTPQAGDSTGQVGSFPNDNTAPNNPCDTDFNDDEYWFEYTPAVAGEALDISVTDITDSWAGVFVLDDCPEAGTPNCIASAQNTSGTGNLTVTTPELTMGVSYKIVITNYGTPDSTSFTMNSAVGTPAVPPVNDDVAGALPLTVGVQFMDNALAGQTNLLATASEVGDPMIPAPGCASYSGGDVWYSVMVPGDGTLTLAVDADPSGNGGDGGGAAYSGSPGALVLIECNDDDGPGLYPMIEVNDPALANQMIYFRVWEFGNNAIINFQVSAYVPVANDECANAAMLTLGTPVSFSNVGATDSGISSSCDSGTISDVWYSFVATATGEAYFGTDAPHLSVWDACGGVEVACNPGNNVAVTVTDGTTYYVRINDDGTARAPGNFELVVGDATLGLEDVTFQGFKYFPNPVKGTLSLRAQDNIQAVSVYNMLGQEVLRTSPNRLQDELDMSGLTTGAYFLKVRINDIEENFRIIKE